MMFLVGALALNYIIIHGFIDKIHSPETYDLFFEILPVWKLRYMLGWGVLLNVLLAIVACAIYRNRLPFAAKAVALLYIIRSFFISITPLGVPADRIVPIKQNILQEMAYSGNDFFFSGHVALPLLLALIFWDISWIRWSFLVIALVFAVGVLFARTHYSIDVFAAPFIVYGVYRISRHYFQKEFDWTRE